MMNHRLSSEYLYSYTKNFEAIKNILKSGFRHSKNVETLPYGNYQQENYIVSFCDILPEQSSFHKEVFGENALSLKKEWGVKNGVSPLRYVHRESPGCNSKYVQLKNDMRTAFTGNDTIGDFLTIVNFIEARKKGKFKKDRIEDEVSNFELQTFLDGISDRFQAKKEKYGSVCITEIFNDWISPLLTQINDLINELELRDSYMRIYQDDFRGIKNKILYEEREWRSVKYIKANENEVKEYLPEEYNLKFDANDLFEILVENRQYKLELISFIEENVPNFCSIIPSIKTLSN